MAVCGNCFKDICICETPADKSPIDELSHPCRETCSGWTHGYQRGLASRKQELEAAHRGAVGLNLRIAELHGQIADAKAQIKDYEEALAKYPANSHAYNVLKKWREK